MKQNSIRSIALLSLIVLVSACASQDLVMAPDTIPGEQLKQEYMIGKWCTDRDLTAQTNKDAGLSTISNLTRQYWNLRETGTWQISETGWMYSNYGTWQLDSIPGEFQERRTRSIPGRQGQEVSGSDPL
jgi:hypothetical protein